MRAKVDFSVPAEIMLGITRKISKDYSVKLDAYSALYLEYCTLMFLREGHRRAARRTEAVEGL